MLRRAIAFLFVGSAMVLGYDIHTQGDRIRQHTGALLAYSGLYDRLTALENLDFFGRIWHMSAGDRRSRAKELLNSLGLWEQRDQLVGGWDRGQRRKLSLARAIFHHPALVFIDEPSDRLSPAESEAIWTDLDNLAARESMTVFLATRDLAEAEALCSAVAIMRQGRILEVGSLAGGARPHRRAPVGDGGPRLHRPGHRPCQPPSRSRLRPAHRQPPGASACRRL